ncbi:MAG: TlpA disulfide reductase family protein [Verrucomicrobia bacterium]|nr:TlpA disulfide reductase family protein [Verrucomicrobiota bacterium]
MNRKFLLLLFAISPVFVLAESEATPSVEEAMEALQAAAIDQEADFNTAYELAEKAGVSEANLLESKVLNLLGGGDLQAVLALIPSMERNAEEFQVGGEGFFTDRDQVYGLIENLKALQASEAGDWEAFEIHVKEGFWKSPELSNMFGISRLITEMRNDRAQKEAMQDLKLPMDMEIQSADGSVTTLAQMVSGRKAVLLDFWASWCGPCISLMPELKHKAEVLPSQGVAVAGMNTDRTDQIRLARQVQEKHGMDMPWLLEPDSSPFSSALMINSIPRMILVSPDGGVLFNGHPMDPNLISTLASIGVNL